MIKPSEKEIENVILDWLRYHPGIFAFKVNTMGVFDQAKGRFRKASPNVIKGTPDILLCLNVLTIPIFVGIEVKSEKGRQTPEQKEFQAKLLRKANGFYFVVRSVSDVETALAVVRIKVKAMLCNYQDKLTLDF